MEDLNVAIRLKGFIDSEGLTHSQFADRCGIPRPSLSQLLSGRNKKISDVIVGQIHKAFPRLSVLWLLFGEGPMLTSDSSDSGFQPEIGQSLDSGLDLFSDTAEFADGRTENEFRGNVSGLNGPSMTPKQSQYKLVENDSKIAELQLQIEKMRQNPRKVSHITVYYDDSTFETFYPQQ